MAAGPPHPSDPPPGPRAVSRGVDGHATCRRATDADLEAQHRVFVAAEGALLARHGFAWPEPPPLERLAPGHRHLLAHDADRCQVAEVDGQVVGYTAAFVRGDTWFLAALFIDPDHQGLGIGRRLLDLAAAGAPTRRLTITDAIQPVSNALYARYGLLPATPILTFSGEPDAEMPAGFEASEPAPGALAALDRVAYGFDRAVDHAYWQSQASGTLWRRGGEAVAYSYRWPSGRLGPVAGRDATSAAGALQAELARHPRAVVEIPGTSRSLVRTALATGLRIVAPAGLLLVSDEVVPPTSLAISSYGLY